MKTIFRSSVIAVSVLLSLSTAFAQKKAEPIVEAPEFTIDEKTSKVVYKGVQEQKGSAGSLYDKAFTWASGYYKNPTRVIRIKDKANGKLTAKARFYIFYTDRKTGAKTRTHTIEYDLTLQFKEGRYRYEITNLIYKATSYQGVEQWIEDNKKKYSYRTASHLKQIDAQLSQVINDFKTAIGKAAPVTEDW